MKSVKHTVRNKSEAKIMGCLPDGAGGVFLDKVRAPARTISLAIHPRPKGTGYSRRSLVEIYCDGSSVGNPGPGGWGAVVTDGARVKEIGGHAAHTTNNKMELTAPAEALKLIKARAKITIHTDSQYVINGITKWVHGWQKNDWLTKEKKDVLNKEEWQNLIEASEIHDTEWKHVKGHSGIAPNERADMIANGFARKEKVELFEGTHAAYKEFLKGMPKARVVSSSSSKKGTAYSYVSLVDGKILTHKTWAECEKRVKGKASKFKKVFSKQEEEALMKEWNR